MGICCMVQETQTGALYQPRGFLWGGRWEGGSKGGEGEMYGKSNMETHIIICKIDNQQEFAVWLRKLKQGLCINLEG